ncbi:MAG: peptidase T [Acidobacteriota bacterium]
MTDSAPPNELPDVAQRFWRYVQIDTQSDPSSDTTPSTAKQFDLARLLESELRDLGLEDVELDANGYVYATLPASVGAESAPTVALLAHMDTSPDEPGGPVRPQLHLDYQGNRIELPGDSSVALDPERSPELLDHLGHDLISSDGTTLLGSDDKAGVAIIMAAVRQLVHESSRPRPRVRVCFTVDEEIARGVDALELDQLGADLGYTVDGGSIGHIDVATFHAAAATIEVRGLMVHPGTAKGVMVNAGTILAEMIDELPADETPETTQDLEGYICCLEIEGTVQSARAGLILRDFEDAGIERRKQIVQEIVARARQKHPAATIELTLVDQYRNMRSYIEESDPRTIELALETARALGLEASEQSIRGGTDGARLSERGLPTPNLFTGGHDYHSRFEWNTVQNLVTSTDFVVALLGRWADVT